MLAGRIGVKSVFSVESDKAFLNAVSNKFRSSFSGLTLHDVWIDIGPTGDWGYPIDRSKIYRYPNYSQSVWRRLSKESVKPDVILIDGRFRVACFLISLIKAKVGTSILFDDYFNRPGYHVVEKHAAVSARHGRMAEFIVNTKSSKSAALMDFISRCLDPN